MNTNRTFISELFLIRTIACLGVVFIHSITVTVATYQLPDLTVDIFRAIQMILMFATPTFIMISELLTAHAYPKNTPKGFLSKRFRFIFIPYLFMGTLYSLFPFISQPFSLDSFFKKWFATIVQAQWHGYFILIILQFYLLHVIYNKFVSRFSPKLVIGISLLINVIYLGYFNFVPPHGPNAWYIWYDFSRLPFLGWIFYFTLAYYCGRNLEYFRGMLTKYKYIIIILCIVVGSLVVISYHTGFIKMAWSNRVDVLVYTILIMFTIFYIGSKFKSVPNIITMISQYSFSIYLLHPLFHKVLNRLSYDLPYINMGVFLLLAFTTGVFGSILISYLLNLNPIGKFMVGKVGAKPRVQEPTEQKSLAS
jgi:membrane-bound acyltransferase YfiQ involved in biofilm formation